MQPENASVIICAYTEDRWDDLVAAVASVEKQTVATKEIIIVIDHNESLLTRARTRFIGAHVVENVAPQGLSGARNSGIAIASGEVIAFLDDDALAAPDWIEQLIAHYDDPLVVGVGGEIRPLWISDRPRWFPEEFDWVVGCTYRGLSEEKAPIRNLIGANMSFRRAVFESVGGFSTGVGQVGASMLRCDDTEFCIRVTQALPHSILLNIPSALVYHRVPPERTSWTYFRTRCYTEGMAKALVASFVGMRDGLASERGYAIQTLPRGVWRGLVDATCGDLSGMGRAGAIVAGLAITTTGYIAATLSRASAPVQGRGKPDVKRSSHVSLKRRF
jgi:GT2 family glycosyltransferase